jgi:signal transduction histidine kinase
MEMLSATLRQTDRARSSGEISEKRLIRQVTELQSEKQRLEELQRLRQDTTELIIHDLRNPLGAIAVSLKLLGMLLPEETRQANRDILEVAEASYVRMQRLVDNLLEVSRMEAGETQFVMARCDLGKLIDEVVSLPSWSAAINRAHIPPRSAAAAYRSRARLITCHNALKYTPDQGRTSAPPSINQPTCR